MEFAQRKFPGSMPIGNGDIGANVWVEPTGDLVLLISKTDAWDENQRLVKIGRMRIKLDPAVTTQSGYQHLAAHPCAHPTKQHIRIQKFLRRIPVESCAGRTVVSA